MHVPEDLRFEIDAPDVHPSNVDTQAALTVFLRYLQLASKLARHEGLDLRFSGVQVLDKCVEFRCQPSDSEAAYRHSVALSAWLSHKAEPPPYIAEDMRKYRAAVASFRFPITTRVVIGSREPVDLPPAPEQPPRLHFTEVISVRATPSRVSVTKRRTDRPAAVRLSLFGEDKEVTLSASLESARALGAHLLREVELTASVERDERGAILGGTLDSFVPVSDADPTEAWRSFYKEVASDWDGVVDIDGEHSNDPRSPACVELWQEMVKHSRDIFIAAPSLAELMRSGRLTSAPVVRGVRVVPFDMAAAMTLARNFPVGVLKQTADEFNYNRTFFKYDALIAACGVRWRVGTLVTIDAGLIKLAAGVGLQAHDPSYFQVRAASSSAQKP